MWISHNRADSIADFDSATEAIAKLESTFDVAFRRFDRLVVAGTDYLQHRYLLTSAPTDSHDAWTDVYARPEFYRWLLQHRRAAQPRKKPN